MIKGNNPLVSIIIPFYNAAEFLQEAIDSISCLDCDYEAIFVNDGSTDSGAQIVKSNIKINPQIKLIHQENQGANRARETGVKYAIGQWITFLDADDLILPVFSELVNSTCKNFNGDIIISYPIHLKGTQQNQIVSSTEYCNLVLREALHTAPFSKLFRREIFNRFIFNIPNHIVSAEDYLMNVRLALSTQSNVLISNIQFYNIRTGRNPSSAMKTFKGNWSYWEEWDELLNKSFTKKQREKHLLSLTDRRLRFWHAYCRKQWKLSRKYYDCQYFRILKQDIEKSGYKVDFFIKLNMSLRNPVLRMFSDIITRIYGVGCKYCNKFCQK